MAQHGDGVSATHACSDADPWPLCVTLEPGSVYSLTTTTGQHQGGAVPPADQPLPIPYTDDFEGYPLGTDAVRFFSEQNGSFEVAGCPFSRPGRCLKSSGAAPPIWWTWDTAIHLGAPSVIGDRRWEIWILRT